MSYYVLVIIIYAGGVAQINMPSMAACYEAAKDVESYLTQDGAAVCVRAKQ